MMGRLVTHAPRMTPNSTDVTSIRTLAVVCVLGVVSAVDLAAQTTVAGDKPQYCVGERLIATFTGSKSPTDWLGIYKAGGSHGSGYPSITWLYTNGTRTAGTTAIGSGSVTFLPLNLAPGKYDLRYFSNDGYTVLAQTNFTVVSGTVAKPVFEVLLIGSSFRTGGYSFSAKIPPGAAGVTCRLQGYAFHAGAKNGMFDASNAVDVELR